MDHPTVRQLAEETRQRGAKLAFSLRLPDGGLAELLYDPVTEKTAFAVWRQGTVSHEPRLACKPGVASHEGAGQAEPPRLSNMCELDQRIAHPTKCLIWWKRTCER